MTASNAWRSGVTAPPQGVMQEALTQYLDREDKRESYRKDALEAWTDYQNTGLHVDAAEVATWLDSWGDDNELSAPECHK